MTLNIATLDAPDAVAAAVWVRDRFPTLGTPVSCLIQSLKELTFGSLDQAPGTLESTTAGSIFGPDAEIRWVARGSGYRLWMISGEGCPPLRCYLWGSYNSDAELFVESHLSVDFDKHYKWLVSRKKPMQNDRPYLELIEYFPELPEGEPSIEKLESFLNQPRTVARRLCGVGM